MKYRFLLKILRSFIYLKRFLWWIGAGLGQQVGAVFSKTWYAIGVVHYAVGSRLKKWGLVSGGRSFFERGLLQLTGLGVVLFFAMPHTKLLALNDVFLPGQNTLAAKIAGPSEEVSLEEVSASERIAAAEDAVQPLLGQRMLPENYFLDGGENETVIDRDLAGIMAGGTAFSKPIILPEAVRKNGMRTQVMEYVVESGDSLSGIATRFGLGVNTIVWENKLGPRSIIRPGDILRILPTNGLVHVVRRGDTFKKIASLYGVTPEEIIAFGGFKADGTDLKVGEQIIVPNGTKPEERQPVRVPRVSPTNYATRAVPPPSRQNPAASGFIWPSGAHYITQYFGWQHNAIDIAGPFGTPTYAAKAGVVEVARCGWNTGYGCFVIIDHGGGVRTLYAHHSKLLVSPGDEVEQGQTIALMGNTGNVRGHTGIHLHFEVIINGRRTNPLGYVR